VAPMRPMHSETGLVNLDHHVHPAQSLYSDLVLPDQTIDYLAYPNHPFRVTDTPRGRNDMGNLHAANPSPDFGLNLTSSGNSASPTQWPTPSLQNVFRGNRSAYLGATIQASSIMPRVPCQKDIRPYDRRFVVKNVDTNTSVIYILDYCQNQVSSLLILTHPHPHPPSSHLFTRCNNKEGRLTN
jgi:hypothetical protein